MKVSGRRFALTSSSRVAIASGTELDDLRFADDAEVQVGHQREGAAPLGGTTGQNDRPGLGNCSGASSDDAIELIQFLRGQIPVCDQLRAGRQPRGR